MPKFGPLQSTPCIVCHYYNDIGRAEPDCGTLTKRAGQAAQKAFCDFHRDAQKFGNYILPKIHIAIIAVGKTSLALVIEATKITAIVFALKIFIAVALPSSTGAKLVIILAPVLEEFLFRGVLLTSLEMMQKGYNVVRHYSHNHEMTKAEIKAQMVFRVRITALVFGLAHLANGHKPIELAVQVTHCIFGGLTYGYFKEKRRSISLPIILHATNNALAVMMSETSYSPYLKLLFCAWLINDWGGYYFATRTPNETVSRKAVA